MKQHKREKGIKQQREHYLQAIDAPYLQIKEQTQYTDSFFYSITNLAHYFIKWLQEVAIL
jgi:hypothetical protein